MANVFCEGNVVILALDRRTDTLLVSVDDSIALAEALESAAVHSAAFVEESIKAGYVLVPKNRIAEPWDAKVGICGKNVAIKFSRSGTRIPLPPSVATELARRIRLAADSRRSGVTIKLVTAR